MRTFFLIFLTLLGSTGALAQTPAPVNAASRVVAAGTSAVEKRTERIAVEDASTRIDELRVGGETQTITVQPKSGMPAYQVAPKTGERSWKILGF